MANPRVLIFGDSIDLVADGKIDNLKQISELKTFRRDKLIDNQYTFTVKNYDNMFSEDNPVSILHGNDWRYGTVKVYNSNEELIWDGVVEDIQPDFENKTVKFVTKSILTEYMDTTIEYESSTWETAAESAKNILDNYSFENYSESIITQAHDLLDANSCYVMCNILKSDGMTLKNAIEKLAEFSASDAYMSRNQLQFKHWQEYSGGNKIILEEKNIYNLKCVSLMSEIINDYSIDYYDSDGTPATDALNDNLGSVSRGLYKTKSLGTFDSGINKQIVFKDNTSAVYVGNQYQKRTHKYITVANRNPLPLKQITFDIKMLGQDWVDMESYFKLNFSDMTWTEKLFEVYGITYNENKNMQLITGVEVDV